MNAEILNQIIKVTESDLKNINNYTPKDMVKDAAKRALHRQTTNRDPLFWPAGMLMLGLSEAAFSPSSSAAKMITDDLKKEMTGTLDAYIKKWIKSGKEISFVDDSISGIAMIKLYEETGEKLYHHSAAKIANFLSQTMKDDNECIIYNPSKGNDLVYADGAGQSAMFLSRYGRVFHKKNAIALASKQLLGFHQYGFDKKSGLPYHAFSSSNESKEGIIGWGRAVGWLMMGYSETLSNICCVDDPSSTPIDASIIKSTSEKLMAEFYNLIKITLEYQRPDGGFSWLIPAVEGQADTSATAMIAYSIANWLRSGMFHSHAADLSKDAQKAVLAARSFLLANTENGSVSASLSSCEDLAVHRQIYGHYPWGQGCTLAALSIIED